ncbi:MAG: DUF2489 domain-containing protein [Porticoccaceae bacterium]
MTPVQWLALAAVAVILPIAAYALVLALRLRRQGRVRRAAEAAGARARRQRDAQARLGIRLLAGAMLEEQITLTEGCQRISYLLGQLEPGDDFPEAEVRVFFQVAEATAHLPILDAWQALDRDRKRACTLERRRIEADFRDFVMVAARRILEDAGQGSRGVPQ